MGHIGSLAPAGGTGGPTAVGGTISQDSISGKPITLPVPMTPALRSIGRALFGLKPGCHDAMMHNDASCVETTQVVDTQHQQTREP